jgi:hypothetical protein
MIQQIQPIQINTKTANKLLVNLPTSSITEIQCEMICYLVDATQTTNYMSVDNISITLPYKLLKQSRYIITGNNFELIKQDENNALTIAANILNVTLI